MRALLAATRTDGTETLLVMPLDHEVEVRVDGDALAMYVASGSVSVPGRRLGGVPAWASAIGAVLLLVVVAFAVLGSLTFFGWLFGSVHRGPLSARGRTGRQPAADERDHRHADLARVRRTRTSS